MQIRDIMANNRIYDNIFLVFYCYSYRKFQIENFVIAINNKEQSAILLNYSSAEISLKRAS